MDIKSKEELITSPINCVSPEIIYVYITFPFQKELFLHIEKLVDGGKEEKIGNCYVEEQSRGSVNEIQPVSG